MLKEYELYQGVETETYYELSRKAKLLQYQNKFRAAERKEERAGGLEAFKRMMEQPK